MQWRLVLEEYVDNDKDYMNNEVANNFYIRSWNPWKADIDLDDILVNISLNIW